MLWGIFWETLFVCSTRADKQQREETKRNFDFIIQLKHKSYVSNISLTLPCGENLLEEGTCSEEIANEFVFKRDTK